MIVILSPFVLYLIFKWYKLNKTRRRTPIQQIGPLSFTDPIPDDFDPSVWELEKHSETDFEWKPTKPSSAFPSEWKFDRNKNVVAGDYVFRSSIPSFPVPENKPTSFHQAAELGSQFYQHVSNHEGCVPNDYSGPMFLLPGLIIACYICQDVKTLCVENRQAFAKYIINHQQEDGGWGTHIDANSSNFSSVLNYTALRLLGVPNTNKHCVKALAYFSSGVNRGANGAPLWAKMWLCTLGVLDYSSLPVSLPPEMNLLPDYFPLHPGKTWCHARMVALPMTYLFGTRFVYPFADVDAVVLQLKIELFPNEFDNHELSHGEIYPCKPSWLLRCGDYVLRCLEFVPLWRRRALEVTLKLCVEEDETNEYICIGPVNKAFNMLVAFASGDSVRVEKHLETVYRYLWIAEDGMKMQGYLNSMVWDSSFCLRAVHKLNPTFARECSEFILKNQLDYDPSQTQQYRDPYCKGGWGFSSKENSYIVSDCTGEAVCALLTYYQHNSIEIPNQIIIPAIDLILWMQNPSDGAWASYEKRRGSSWYEWFNPAAVFSDIMIDYSYVECTSSCIQALIKFIESSQDQIRVQQCRVAVERGLDYLFMKQREDGSWFGEWGVCFTYASFFACEALSNACKHFPQMENKIKYSLNKLSRFLLSKQQSDGGWGESVEACKLKVWIACKSNVVNTSWALLALVQVARINRDQEFRNALMKGGNFLLETQTECGDWIQPSSLPGVFNKTCGIAYTSYRNVFPIWALEQISSLVTT
jgi:squalene/oxidosqualene cyclase-like protein